MPFNEGESYADTVGRPEESAADIAAAAWNNFKSTQSIVGSVVDGWKREGLDEGSVNKLSPLEINKQYPGLNADRDTSIHEARFIMEKRAEVQRNQQIIDSASDSFLKGTVLPFVAGAGAMVTDPIDMGINFVTGGLGSSLKVGAGLGRKIAIDALEAGVGAAIAEAPIAMEMEETFEDYTAKQFLTNVIGASLLQVGLMHGVGKAWEGTARSVEFMGAKTSDGLIKVAEVMEKQGMNSSSILNHSINKMKELTGKADEVHLAVKETLGDKVPLGKDMIESMDNVVQAHEMGKITDAEFANFTNHAMELGVDERVLQKAVDPDATFKQTEAEIAEFKEVMNKSSQKFDPKIQKMSEELEEFNPLEYTKKHLAEHETKIDAETKAKPESADPNVSEVITEKQKVVQEKEFLRELAACRRGA